MEKFCKWYLSFKLRLKKLDNIEIVIRSNDNTLYKRNKDREKSIEETLKKIK